MSMFRKEAAVAAPEPEITGITILRQSAKVWCSKPGGSQAIANAIEGLGISALENFAAGRADLPVEMLQKLTRVLHPHAEYDVASGMLQAVAPPAQPLGLRTEPYQPGPVGSGYPPVIDRTAPPRGLKSVTSEPVRPHGPKPGWLGGFRVATSDETARTPRQPFVRAPAERG